MRELQIEVLEWMLKEDQKPAHHLTDENRARVKKELAELKASDKPRPPDYPFAK